MSIPQRALRSLLGVFAALALSGADAGVRVLHEARSADGTLTLQWLGRSDGTCTGMRLLQGTAALAGMARYARDCSRIRAPFSPDGQHVVFMQDAPGPIHVVPTRMLVGYLLGDVMADRVIYPSEQPGMPPSPERLVEFLGWRSPDVFEISGACCGGASRYSYILSQGRIVETCHKDALRPACLHRSPDGTQVVLLTGHGFHVVAQPSLEAFLLGNSTSTFVPVEAWRGVTRPTFLQWQPGGRLLLQGEAGDQQPHHFTLDVTTGELTKGARVEWEWKRELP